MSPASGKLLQGRPLPRQLRPYPDEVTLSFTSRLETANALRTGLLIKTLRRSRMPWIESLSLWSGRPPESLCLAMPQLCHHRGPAPHVRPAGRPSRTTHAWACHRCALERTGTLRVEIYTTHDQVLCPRHRLWTGEGVHGPTEQLSIQAAPEVLAAWHHHKNLVTRFGRSGVRKAFHIAGIINWRWYDQFHHFTPALDTYDALAGNQPRNANSHAAVAAALYPSVVALAAIMASPYWARIAHSGRPAQFLERVTSEVTDGWAPTGAADTLRFWMNEDWLPGFRGSDRLPGKVSPESPVQLGQFRVSSVS